MCFDHVKEAKQKKMEEEEGKAKKNKNGCVQ